MFWSTLWYFLKVFFIALIIGLAIACYLYGYSVLLTGIKEVFENLGQDLSLVGE